MINQVWADETIKKTGIALHYFEKLEDVMKHIGFIQKKSAKKSDAGKEETSLRPKKK